MTVTEQSVRALRDKYREMKRMRELDAAGHTPDPRREMAELARRFPGALRELDELPMQEIARRLSVLDAAIEGAASVPEWVGLQVDYHGFMRAVLRIKRWFGKAALDDVTAVLDALRTRYEPAPDEPPVATFDRAALRAILEPDAGRLNPWVFERVAALHGVEPADVQKALFRAAV